MEVDWQKESEMLGQGFENETGGGTGSDQESDTSKKNWGKDWEIEDKRGIEEDEDWQTSEQESEEQRDKDRQARDMAGQR